MDTAVASELLIALTSLAGHLESTEDPKSAGCGPGFGFLQERDGAPLSLAGTREAFSGGQGGNGKEDGMWQREAGLSDPQGSARNRHHPMEPDSRDGGKGPQQAACVGCGASWLSLCESEPCLCWEPFLQARGGRPAPSGLRVSQWPLIGATT